MGDYPEGTVRRLGEKDEDGHQEPNLGWYDWEPSELIQGCPHTVNLAIRKLSLASRAGIVHEACCRESIDQKPNLRRWQGKTH